MTRFWGRAARKAQREKETRVMYQGVVYELCNEVDQHLAAKGIRRKCTVGTVAADVRALLRGEEPATPEYMLPCRVCGGPSTTPSTQRDEQVVPLCPEHFRASWDSFHAGQEPGPFEGGQR